MRGACSVQYYYPSSRRRRQSICSAVILKTPLFSLVDLFTALLAARQAAGALQSRSPARGHYFTDSVTAHVRPTSGSYFCFSLLHFRTNCVLYFSPGSGIQVGACETVALRVCVYTRSHDIYYVWGVFVHCARRRRRT